MKLPISPLLGGGNQFLNWLTDKIFPIGAYFSTEGTFNPNNVFAGEWGELPQGTFLEAAGSGGTAGVNHEAGLPNIKGAWRRGSVNENTVASGGSLSGAFYPVGSKYAYPTIGNAQQSYDGYLSLGFDASKSNSIYKDGVTTVQPKSITAHIWKRTK